MSTSIEVSDKTKHLLDQFVSDNDYDKIISKLLKLIPEGDEEGEYTPEFRQGLLNAKLEVLEGDLIDHDDVLKSLGLDD